MSLFKRAQKDGLLLTNAVDALSKMMGEANASYVSEMERIEKKQLKKIKKLEKKKSSLKSSGKETMFEKEIKMIKKFKKQWKKLHDNED